jgi:hypothetical protein
MLPGKKTESPRSTLRFRELGFGDHERLATLSSQYGFRTETCEEWARLWTDNPVYQAVPDWPMGWVFENQNGEIVGHLANVPLLYELGEKRLIASATRALMVESQYRNYSLQLVDQFFRQKEVDLFLATTVNAHAIKLFEVFRALRVPVGTWDKAAFWITGYSGFCASVLTMQNLKAAKVLEPLLSAGLLVQDTLRGRWWKTRSGNVEPESCTGFDERFESFWQELRKRYPNRLLANRSRAMLEWHFKRLLTKKRAWVLALSTGSSLTAYAIFVRQDNPAHSLTRIRLVDFQSLGDDEELLRPLLCCGLERCRQEGIHMLEAVGFPPEKQKVLDRLSPRWRKLDAWRYFYKAAKPGLAESLRDPQSWDPSCFDGDASL